MKEYIVLGLLMVMRVLFGAWWLSNAIREFKAQRYFLFGANIMLTIFEAANLIKYVLR